jgi:eukaryotic-like serine/threonine-protein kinase
MPLAAGARLGPYEIQSVIGAGGMGEVYKARDTRLDRVVAIKILRADIAGPDFRERFAREAKVISQLDHPHICTVFDVGHEDGIDFLVMQYLDGETLAARLASGPIPVNQALTYAIQMADALDRAHRQGIMHRDMKPGNAMVTASGVVLVDFGLAKAVAAPVSTSATQLAAAPTMTSPLGPTATPLTAAGTILGTFQYMAPEVIEGDDADARADLWGFGCILYEMLTGRRAFSGRSQASLLGAILKEEPASVSAVQPLVPPALDRVVRTCLAKDPNQRIQSAHDLALQLRWIAEGGSAAGVPAPIVAGRRWRDRSVWAAAGLAAGTALATVAAILWPRHELPPKVTRFTYLLPADQQLSPTARREVAISPDGTVFAYITDRQIYR